MYFKASPKSSSLRELQTQQTRFKALSGNGKPHFSNRLVSAPLLSPWNSLSASGQRPFGPRDPFPREPLWFPRWVTWLEVDVFQVSSSCSRVHSRTLNSFVERDSFFSQPPRCMHWNWAFYQVYFPDFPVYPICALWVCSSDEVWRRAEDFVTNQECLVLTLVCRKQGGALRRTWVISWGFGFTAVFFCCCCCFPRVAGSVGSGSTVQTLSK